MRVSREKATENRQKIVETAARLFRERGFDRVGVDAIMEGAGLTHGGFYGHFKSKDDLAAEAVTHALAVCEVAAIGDVPAVVSVPSAKYVASSGVRDCVKFCVDPRPKYRAAK